MASLLLKNFRADGGLDCDFPLERAEFTRLVSEARQAWLAHGRVSYGPQSQSEATSSCQIRRSRYFVRDFAAGDTIDATAVRAIRPGHGLPPGEIDRLIGRRVSQAVVRGTPVSWELVR
jgi:N-acetylneuraminate synthase